MKTLKVGVVLLALLLAGLAMAPVVSAANRPMPLVDWSNVAPTQPLAEKDLVTFVITERTLAAANVQKDNPTIVLNSSDFRSDGKLSVLPGGSELHIQNALNAEQPVAVLTIPKSMYTYFRQNSPNDSISVPRDMFRTYATFGKYTEQAALSVSTPVDAGTVYTNKTPTAIGLVQPDTATQGYRYQKWDEFLSDPSGIQATYLTGKISPAVYTSSPGGVFIFQEQELHLNRFDNDGDGIDVIEIVAAYDVSNTPPGSPQGINLFPVFYNGDISQDPIYTGYIHIPSALKTYNFYLGIGTGSNLGKYELWLQDTATNQWLAYWYYQDNVNPSQYIRSPRVASEITILQGASGSFFDITWPITDEHAMQGSTWYTPQQVFSYWRPIQNVPNLRFVSTTWEFLTGGNLVMGSVCQGSI